MPIANSRLRPDARISVSKHYLRRTTVPEQLRGTTTDFNAPGLRFNGIIRESFINGQGKNMFKVVLDILPDTVIDLAPTCLCLEERRQHRFTPRSSRIPPVQAGQAAEILEDAMEEEEEEEEQEEEEVVDATWVESAINVDVRLSNPASSYGRSDPYLLNFPGFATASPAAYFLHFLPVGHIQNVVIPAINGHVRKQLLSWVDVNYVEYLTWIMLCLIMTVCKFTDRKCRI